MTTHYRNKWLSENTTLIKNITKKLGGGKLTQEERNKKLSLCKILNSGKDHAKTQWKFKIRKFQNREYKLWIQELHNDLCKDTSKRSAQTLEKHVINLGIGTSYLMSLRTGTHITITHVNSRLQADLKTSLRQLKSGLLPHILIMTHMYENKWYKMSFEDKLSAVMCPCGLGVQDIFHIMNDCENVDTSLRA